MDLKGIVNILMAFVILSLLAYLGLNWVSEVPAPSDTNSEEYKQYTNLTNTSEVGYTAQEGVLYLIITLMIISGVLLMLAVFK